MYQTESLGSLSPLPPIQQRFTMLKTCRKHVYGDLRPYVCLESKCDLENFQFTKRREWISHVMSSHWRVFRCSFGCQESFASAEECEIHLESKHLTSIQKGGLESLAKQSSRPMDFSRGMECPLCRVQIGSFRLYKRHVGRHQEQMALFALPTQEAQDQDIDEDDNESLGSSNGSDEQGGSTDTSRQRASIIEHLKSIGREEARRAGSSQPLPNIAMTHQEYETTAEKLRQLVVDTEKIGRGLLKWYQINHDDVTARKFFELVCPDS